MPPFPEADVRKLLVECHRRCCVCHKFCGVKIELDHIQPRGQGGADTIDNAIAVCFECHAEIHLYNPQHPKGRRFTPEELRHHRDQWLEICRTRPEILTDPARAPNPGYIERLIHELDFDKRVAVELNPERMGCPFQTSQFEIALAEGTFSWLDESVRTALEEAYMTMRRANALLQIVMTAPDINVRRSAQPRAQEAFREVARNIEAAQALLRDLLEAEEGHN
jgi:hypothetical protein